MHATFLLHVSMAARVTFHQSPQRSWAMRSRSWRHGLVATGPRRRASAFLR